MITIFSKLSFGAFVLESEMKKALEGKRKKKINVWYKNNLGDNHAFMHGSFKKWVFKPRTKVIEVKVF